MFLKKKNDIINAGKINGSSINGMTISADIISVNNDKGCFEIGNKQGQTVRIKADNKILVFVGGILVDIEEV